MEEKKKRGKEGKTRIKSISRVEALKVEGAIEAEGALVAVGTLEAGRRSKRGAY